MIKFLLMLLILSSCAMSNIVLKKTELKPYKASSKISFISVSRDINLVEIVDKRINKSDIGYGLTGSTYSKTPVYLANGAVPFMTNYFTEAFEKRNIIINPNSKNRLSIEILKLEVSEVIEKFQPEKAKCYVKFNFNIKKASGQWSSEKWVKFLSGGDMSDGTERLGPTFASCMNDLIEKLVNDVEFKKALK